VRRRRRKLLDKTQTLPRARAADLLNYPSSTSHVYRAIFDSICAIRPTILDVVRKTFAENEIQNIVLTEFINKGVECFKRYDFFNENMHVQALIRVPLTTLRLIFHSDGDDVHFQLLLKRR